MSNADLTATRTNGSGTWRGGRSLNGYSSGKYYIEVVCDTAISGGGSNVVGIADSSATLSLYVSSDSHSTGWVDDGKIYRNNSVIGTIASYGTASDNCGMALDIDNGKIWYRKNGGNWNNDILANQNPATNTGGFSFTLTGPLYIFFILTTTPFACTMKPSSSDWAYAAPSGFTQT